MTESITTPKFLVREGQAPLRFDAVQLAFMIHDSLEGALAWDTADSLNDGRTSRMYHGDANELASVLYIVEMKEETEKGYRYEVKCVSENPINLFVAVSRTREQLEGY
ncbi:hypothetical protein HYT57_00710 [Candidatus Woesearchaeota archaeon]|nr:hypothetical protein [Candidatus Woesearchaeota archaeon]